MLEEVAFVCLFLALGGILKGATGMGTPVIAVPALAAYFDVPFAIAILVVPNFATNGWQIFQHRAELGSVPFLKRFVISGCIGALVGTLLLIELPSGFLSLWLAVIVVVYIGLRLAHPHWRVTPRLALGASPPIGLISGILQGATGISAPVSVTFLSAMQLPRPQFIISVSSLFIGFFAIQAPTLAIAGILTWERLALSVLAVLPIGAAMPVGAWLARKLNPQTFDRLVLTFLAAMAAKLFYDAGLFG